MLLETEMTTHASWLCSEGIENLSTQQLYKYKEAGCNFDEVDAGVTNSFSFGPILVEDYQVNAECVSSKVSGRKPRSAIGYVEPGHYVMVACDGRDYGVSRGLTIMQLAKIFEKEGCALAYNLDGGMTSAVLFMGNYITHRAPSSFYRTVAELIYVGTNKVSPVDLQEYVCDYEYYSDNYK